MEWDKVSYYVVQQGKPAGPFTFTDLQQMHLLPTDFVKVDNMPEFKELHEIQGLSALLGVQYQRTAPQYFAALDVRLLAWGIDFFLALFLYGLLGMVYLFGSEPGPERIPNLIIGLALVPVLKFVFSSIMEGSVLQASPGKLLIGIKVVDAGGNPINPLKAFARNSAKLLGVMTLGIGFFVGFFDLKQRCLHDRITKTMVIKGRLI